MHAGDLRALLESLGRLARDEEERFQCELCWVGSRAPRRLCRCSAWGLAVVRHCWLQSLAYLYVQVKVLLEGAVSSRCWVAAAPTLAPSHHVSPCCRLPFVPYVPLTPLASPFPSSYSCLPGVRC